MNMNKDRIEGTAKTMGGKLEEDFGRISGDAKSEVEGAVKQVVGTAQDIYGQVRDTAGDAATAVRRQAGSLEETIRENVEARPYTAVAIALAVGWCVGRLGRSY
ncbi:MAG TPA: CsbD family protein [Xanthobacteraceae bacterium]